jgi:integrase/recombinase XerD
MLRLRRRHLIACPHRSITYRRCRCPIWVYGSKEGKRIRRSLDTTSWEHGEELLRAEEWEGGITLVEGWNRFLADCTFRNVGPAQYHKYDLVAEEMKARFPSRTVRSLTTDDLSAYAGSWKHGATTRRSRLGRLKTFFRFAAEREWVRKNPAVSLKPPKEERRQIQPFSDSEMEKIMFALELYADRPRGRRAEVRAFVLVLRYTGLRIRDAVRLKKNNIVGGRLILNTQKAKTTVSLPLPEEVIKSLEAVEGPGEWYFWSGKGLPKTGVADWQRSLSKLFEISGVEGNAHRFRHTLATTLLSKGVSTENVAEILGNSPKVVHKHYSAWIVKRQEALDAEVEKIWR